MDNKLQNNILDAFTTKSKKKEKRLKNGLMIEYNCITFSEISKHINSLCSKNDVQFPGVREIKRKIINLIEKKIVVEIFGEPPIYLLSEEFNKFKQE